MNITDVYRIYQNSYHLTTSSNEVHEGSIFVGLQGEKVNGGSFSAQALERGAALCIVDDERYVVSDRCLVVPNTLAFLQSLAALHRQTLSLPVIAITGTNGKTTTKELTNAVLSKKYHVHATVGNHNNHIGVPLTLLSATAKDDILVVEMGANHPHEIEELCNIAGPNAGIITNVGRAHLEGFGSFEGVINTKTELYRFLAHNGGTVFVDADNPILLPIAQGFPHHFSYGRSRQANICGTVIANNPYLKFSFEVSDQVFTVQTHLLGQYNFANAMAAVSIGIFYGVEPFDIKSAIEEYIPSNNRSQLQCTQHNTLYLDCYNANPSSMQVAIDSFASMQAVNKWAVIGGMKELGGDSFVEHKNLVEKLAACGFANVVLVGDEFSQILLPKGFLHFHTTEQLCEWLSHNPVEGATILIKGSNSNRLWTLIPSL